MHTVNVIGVANYQRCQQVHARQLVANMSDEEKRHTLDIIKIHLGISNLEGLPHDSKMLQYVERLLTGGNNE